MRDTLNSVNKIVHFGWKKEAIPISKSKKSIIAKFFSKIFRVIFVFFRNISCFKYLTLLKYNRLDVRNLSKNFIKKHKFEG